MHPKSALWLEDIVDRCGLIRETTANLTLADYQKNAVIRAAVERSFEVIGEALRRIEQLDSDIAQRIPEYRRVIGFRNRLIHEYDDIDDEMVWTVIQNGLPPLEQRVRELLYEYDQHHS